MTGIAACGLWLMIVLITTALVIRLTVKDGLRGADFIFYATPLAVLILLTLVVAFGFYWLKKRRWATISMLACCVLTVWWLSQDWRFSSAPTQDETGATRILFWNVARRHDLSPALRVLQSRDADIIGLAEVEGSPEKRRAELQAALPSYSVSVLGGGLYLLCKGESGVATATTLGPSSIARLIQVHQRDQIWPIVLVDIYGNPFHSRIPLINRLAEFCDSAEQCPVIIMGDFNLPSDAASLASLRDDYRLLSNEVGTGYSGTWPVPVPVMQLDQIWGSARIVPLSYRKWYSSASDHAAIEVTARMKDAQATSP